MDCVLIFMKELRQFSVLPQAEIRELIAKAQAGDIEARNKVVMHNMPMVINMANKRATSAAPLEDLAQVGAMGLIRAIAKFELDRGLQFSTYATFWVKQFIASYLQGHSHTIYLPRHIYNAKYKTNPDVIAAVAAARRVASIDDPHEDQQGRTLSVKDIVRDARNDYQAMIDAEDMDHRVSVLMAAMDKLPERSRAVLKRRAEGELLKDVATVIGVTRERVRQIEVRSFRELATLLGADPNAVGSISKAS